MDDIILARALHVLAVVIWIGGVAMATTVVLPGSAVRRPGRRPAAGLSGDRAPLVWQARTAVIVVGLTGLHMTRRLDLWDRFQAVTFWWMHAMVCVWLPFAFVLFVAEPFILNRHFRRWATEQPGIAFAWLHRAHRVLLALSLVTIVGAVAGSQGWSFF